MMLFSTILWCRALLIVVQLKNQHTTNCWWWKPLFPSIPLFSFLHQCHSILSVYDKRKKRIHLHSNNISILHQICKWFRITSIQTISQYSCCDEEIYMRDLICMKIFSLHSIKFLSKFYVFFFAVHASPIFDLISAVLNLKLLCVWQIICGSIVPLPNLWKHEK